MDRQKKERGLEDVGVAAKQKASCVQGMVSQNRRRFHDDELNLDLTYISKRVIAMGFPAEGMGSVYRNSRRKVAHFFEKYHANKVKVGLLRWHDRNVRREGLQSVH